MAGQCGCPSSTLRTGAVNSPPLSGGLFPQSRGNPSPASSRKRRPLTPVNSPPLQGGFFPNPEETQAQHPAEEAAADSVPAQRSSWAGLRTRMILAPDHHPAYKTRCSLPTLMSRFGQSCFSRGVRDRQPPGKKKKKKPGRLQASSVCQQVSRAAPSVPFIILAKNLIMSSGLNAKSPHPRAEQRLAEPVGPNMPK